MAVYATRCNRVMRSVSPLKRTHKRNERQEKLQEFMRTHDVSFKKDEQTGDMIAITKERNQNG